MSHQQVMTSLKVHMKVTGCAASSWQNIGVLIYAYHYSFIVLCVMNCTYSFSQNSPDSKQLRLRSNFFQLELQYLMFKNWKNILWILILTVILQIIHGISKEYRCSWNYSSKMYSLIKRSFSLLSYHRCHTSFKICIFNLCPGIRI